MANFECGPTTNIVVAGGGGGAPLTAKALAGACPESTITLIQGTHDHGGSSGVLRDEFGVPAMGDVAGGLAAFSAPELSEPFNTRFGAEDDVERVRTVGDKLFDVIRQHTPGLDEAWAALQLDRADEVAGELADRGHSMKGHTYRNLLLTGQMLDGNDIGQAAARTSELLGIAPNHRVVPAVLAPHELVMHDGDDVIVGEGIIDEHTVQTPEDTRVWLSEGAELNPEAREAIQRADAFVIAPGTFYTSVAPVLATPGMADALRAMPASSPVTAVANLVTEPKESQAWTLSHYLKNVEAYSNPASSGGRDVDHVIFNTDLAKLPPGTEPVVYDRDNLELLGRQQVAVGANLIDEAETALDPNDSVKRSAVHHNPAVLGGTLLAVVQERRAA